MKKLLITLLLISPFSFADWGDVYYCDMTSHSKTSPEGERTDYSLGKFKFKLDKTKYAMAFGKEGYFVETELELTGRGLPSRERWYAANMDSMVHFNEGKFIYVALNFFGSSSMSADCEKF